jgi:hypothetical protein
MLFENLSIEAMDYAIKKYRDENNPILLDLDYYEYEFTKRGEHIPHTVIDMFGHSVELGDIVTYPSANRNSISIYCGKVQKVSFINKKGEPLKDGRIYIGFPPNDPDKDRCPKNQRWSRAITISRAKNHMIKVNGLI